MNNMDNTKKLANSAPLIALLIISSLLGTLPFFSLISLSVGPIIVALIYHKAGKFYTGLSFIVTTILLAVMINPIFGLTITMLTFIIGAGLIYMIAKNHGVLLNFVVLTLAIIAGYLAMTFVDITVISQISISEFLTTIVDGLKVSMVEISKLYEQAGGNISENPAIVGFQNLTVQSLLSFIPTVIAMYAILAATIIYKIAYIIFKRMGIPLKPLPGLSEIKTNMVLVLSTLLVAMLGVMLVALGVNEAEGIMHLGNNLFILSGAVGGISLISYFMKNKLK
ncbi:MAG: DUF2232 domain-containing protein, partial [Clostridium sp.]|nr:DUF2232 domain-containing protein [Clostridium sp.]